MLVSGNEVIDFTGNCVGDDNGNLNRASYDGLSLAKLGIGGGLYITGNVAATLSCSDFSLGNMAAFGASVASTQGCKPFPKANKVRMVDPGVCLVFLTCLLLSYPNMC